VATTSTKPKKRRAKPGAKGGGAFFHVEVRPKRQFVTFRVQDMGGKGGIERVAGQRASGSWATQKWLIGKTEAHIEGDRLVPDTEAARHILDMLGSAPVHVEGDRFRAKDRPNVPERLKPTPRQRRAQRTNIKKAQATTRTRRKG
jgi:hypothetical protein